VLHGLNVISFGKTRYKPGCKDRALDVRARNVHDEYVDTGQGQESWRAVWWGGGREAWPCGEQAALIWRVQGIVVGNYGEVSEATHKLLDTIATSRVRVALPQAAAASRQAMLLSERQGRSIIRRGFARLD
jgi:hypothetical protein